MMHRFLIVVEKTKKNFAAYSPDLPGCAATGKTRAATTQNMYDAIALHIEGLIEDGIAIPSSSSFAEYVAMPGKKTKKTRSKRVG